MKDLKASGEVATQHAVNVPIEGSNPSLPAKPIFSASHVFCQECGKITKVYIEPFQALDTTMQYIGGDIVCQGCSIIIATLYNVRK